MPPPCQEKEDAMRIRLSLAQKVDIIHKLRAGFTAPAISKEYGCCPRTIRNIKRKQQEIINIVESSLTTMQTKSLRASKYPAIEDKLVDFVHFARNVRMPVTSAALQMKALMLRDILLRTNYLDQKTKTALQEFTASKGWVAAFVRRKGLRSVSLHGEGGSVNVLQVAEEINTLRKRLCDYSLDNIYNVDETGLFFKLFPKKTYVSKHEDRKTVRGTKNMKAKDRVSAFVCTNASGTRKVPMALIGTAKNPRCFSVKPPSLPYFSQKNAWSDTTTFRQWYYKVFLPDVRKYASDKVVLLMDNCGPHGTDLTDSNEQVTVVTLPPNCTARYQPMDAGVIAAWKLRYKQELLRRVLRNVEYRDNLRKAAANWKAGTKGIEQGYGPHISDVCEIGSVAWEEVKEETVARCWLKTDILPPGHEAILVSSYGKVSKVQKLQNDSDYEELWKLFKEMKLKVPENNSLEAELEDVTNEDIVGWANVEEAEDVRKAIVNDLMESIEKDMLEHNKKENEIVSMDVVECVESEKNGEEAEREIEYSGANKYM